MSLNFHSLFCELDPYRLVHDLGISIRSHRQQFLVPVPGQKEQWVQLTEDGVRALTRHFPQQSGSIWDYLARHFNPGRPDYLKLVEHVIQQYRSNANNPAGLPLESFKEQFAEDLRRQRQHFEDILSLSFNLEKPSPRLNSIYLWFRKNRINHEQVSHLVYAATGDQILKTLQLADLKLKPELAYLIYPYFTNAHSFALLRIFDPQKPEEYISVPLNPGRLSWFGLNSGHGLIREYRIYPHILPLLTDYSRAVQHGTFDLGFVSPDINPQGNPEANKLPRGVFMDEGTTSLARLVQFRETVQEFHLGSAQRNQANFNPAECLSWLNYIRHLFLAELAKGERALNLFLDTLQTDREVMTHVLEWLKRQPLAVGELDRVKRRLERPRVLLRTQGVELRETETGYHVRKTKKDQENFITNFTIHLAGALWFPDTEELFYHGKVRLHNQEAPLVLSRQQLTKAGDVERVCTAAVHRTLGEQAAVPLITDPSHNARLATAWLTQAAQLPRETGVNQLGWTADQQTFIAPSWQARALGVRSTSHQAHPYASHLKKYYRFKDLVPQDSANDIPPLAQNHLAVIMAQLGRHFLNLPYDQHYLQRSPEAFLLMTGLFYPLGQCAPYELNPNRRPKPLVPEGLNGYPVYGTCPDEGTLKDLRHPITLIGETGEIFDQVLSTAGYSQLCWLSQQAVQAVTVGLLRQPQIGLRLLQKTPEYLDDRIAEGTALVTEYGGPRLRVLLSDHADTVPLFVSPKHQAQLPISLQRHLKTAGT